ncbi:MAG TPA: sensor histidine kinase [Mariprofundaceae bacterium]|nr:sensor histidine kinase [Mariprofundaceae bacterium]
MRSLSRQLAVSLAVSLATFFVVQAVMVVVEVRSLNEDTVVSRMHHDAEELMAALDIAAPNLAIDWSHVPTIYERPFSGHYFQFRMENQSLRSRSLWDEELPVVDAGDQREISGPAGQQLLLLGKQYMLHGQPVQLTIGEDISQLEQTAGTFLERLLLTSFIALLVLLAMQVWFIRRGLSPLNKLKDELQLLEAGEIDSLQQPVPAEIEPLVAEANRLLVAIRQRLERSRNAIGNLAHALKTPLTVATQILEREPSNQDRRELQQQIGLIQQRIQRELSHARMAGQSPGGFWRSPVTDIQDLVNTMQRIHRKTIGSRLQLAADSVLRADREDMMELVGNLLDNACKWAAGEVRLGVTEHPLTIIVEDDGPGMDEPTRERVLGRGVRADESKAGHGLGLAIVSDLVNAYAGSLELDRSPELGGLKVTVQLPVDMQS